MGMWRSFKGWMKRTVLRIVLRIARTRIYKFARKIARVSAVPLTITAAACGVGSCVAYTVAFPIAYGALIGASAGVGIFISWGWWLRYTEAQRARRRTITSVSAIARKVSENIISKICFFTNTCSHALMLM